MAQLEPGVTEHASPCYGAPCIYCWLPVRGILFRKKMTTSMIPGLKSGKKICSFYYWHINCGEEQ